MTDEELGRHLCQIGNVKCDRSYMTSDWYAIFGAAARALLSPPVATKALPSHDELKHEMWEAFRNCDGTYGEIASACATVARQYLDALSHFAPPASNAPILQMSVEEIERDMRSERGKKSPKYLWDHRDAARVAHRLAQPVPEVDPDAGAKRLALEHHSADCVNIYSSPDDYWQNAVTEARRVFWRKHALQEKSNG